MKEKQKHKEFGISSWAINNKMTVYVMMALILVMGISSYFSMPRESFPEIKETKIYISSVFPGNTAEDVEKLITDPLEEELQNLSGVVNITSTSQEDYSMIMIEFEESMTVEEAKVRVKDKVDIKKAGEDWPIFNNAKVDPNVFDLNMSEAMPIVNVNIMGDFKSQDLKKYAELIQEKIEQLPQIKEATLLGAQDKEVEIAVDIYKMTASKINFQDIITAVSGGNSTVSAGNIINNGQRRTLRVIGEIDDPKELESFVIKNEGGAIYLGDIATVSFKEKDRTTYARDQGRPVVMLSVKKLAGKNMVEAVDGVKRILKEAKESYLPKGIEISITNDQSARTIGQVDDLVNNIIFGILLVVGVLMFFLGLRNALFVGIAIPMSMFMSFMILSALGFTMNTMVLFALVMGLGMLVDNGIVVVENVYRLMHDEGMTAVEAAKKGVGEIATPIIISTATTIGAFIPLGMWPGVMGQFMIYFPMTLSVVLGSSLFVALIMNSMLTSVFMKLEESTLSRKSLIKISGIMLAIGILFLIFISKGVGTLLVFFALMGWVYKYAILPVSSRFQGKTLVSLENGYRKLLNFALKGAKPYAILGITIFMFFASFVILGLAAPKVEFFPDNEPNQVFVYIEYPQGTDIEKTNDMTLRIEEKVKDIAKKYINEDGYNYMVESNISQVGEGAGNPQVDGGSEAEMPHKGKITFTMVESKFRDGYSSSDFKAEVSEAVKGFAGVKISVEKEASGPPAGYPINIEIKGNDYDQLIKVSEKLRSEINSFRIAGIEKLKIDVNKDKPGTQVLIDRKKAGQLGVSAGQLGRELRRSVFGEKASVYKKDGEDYDIYVRFNEQNRYNKNSLLNQKIIFRDPANGKIKDIPIASLVTTKNTSSFSAIKHRGVMRMVTVYSAISTGYNANEIVANLKEKLKNYKVDEGVTFKFTGEMEKQEENMKFLMGALASGLGIIVLLLVFQFNSISKPLIILMSIFLSFIGVLLGIVIFDMTFVIIMTMVGIISLAGIVVNNGVVLLDYTQLLIDRKKIELDLNEDQMLPLTGIFEAIVEGGTARLRPVLLTAITTVLGLIPLAIGLNIDFFSLVSDWDPKIYVGGDNVIFWGPLAWTVIFGLTFATFLTLVIVPISFYLVNVFKIKVLKR